MEGIEFVSSGWGADMAYLITGLVILVIILLLAAYTGPFARWYTRRLYKMSGIKEVTRERIEEFSLLPWDELKELRVDRSDYITKELPKMLDDLAKRKLPIFIDREYLATRLHKNKRDMFEGYENALGCRSLLGCVGILTSLIDINREGFYYNWDRIADIPEFAKLKETPQSKMWHREGNAWEHTRLVCKEAEKFVNGAYSPRDFSEYQNIFILMGAALFHDIGKGPVTVEKPDGRIVSYGHDSVGASITRRLLWDIEPRIRERICSLVRYHMKPLNMFDDGRAGIMDKVVELSMNTDLKYLVLLKKFDSAGSVRDNEIGYCPDIEEERLNFLLSVADSARDLGQGLRSSEYRYSARITENPTHPKRKDTTIYVMVGLPGAGKTTFAKGMYGNKDLYRIISRDDIRASMGYSHLGEDGKAVTDQNLEAEVTKKEDQMIRDAIKAGLSPVICDTNLTKKSRKRLRNVFGIEGIHWVMNYIEAATFEGQRARRKKEIPDDRIYIGMADRFEWPEAEEYDELHLYVSTFGTFLPRPNPLYSN